MRQSLFALAALWAVTTTVTAAEITMFENDNFNGRRIATYEAIPNLGNSGFNDRAQSLRVERGYWMFCSDAFFQGTCRTFGPGEYPDLPRNLNNAVSSGRRISNDYPYNHNPNWQN